MADLRLEHNVSYFKTQYEKKLLYIPFHLGSDKF